MAGKATRTVVVVLTAMTLAVGALGMTGGLGSSPAATEVSAANGGSASADSSGGS